MNIATILETHEGGEPRSQETHENASRLFLICCCHFTFHLRRNMPDNLFTPVISLAEGKNPLTLLIVAETAGKYRSGPCSVSRCPIVPRGLVKPQTVQARLRNARRTSFVVETQPNFRPKFFKDPAWRSGT